MDIQRVHNRRAEFRKVVRLFSSQSDLAETINYHIKNHQLDVVKVRQQQISNWLDIEEP